MSLEVQVTFDAADPGALAGFWADALGYRVQDPPGGFATWDEALDAWGIPAERRNDASAVVELERDDLDPITRRRTPPSAARTLSMSRTDTRRQGAPPAHAGPGDPRAVRSEELPWVPAAAG